MEPENLPAAGSCSGCHRNIQTIAKAKNDEDDQASDLPIRLCPDHLQVCPLPLCGVLQQFLACVTVLPLFQTHGRQHMQMLHYKKLHVCSFQRCKLCLQRFILSVTRTVETLIIFALDEH